VSSSDELAQQLVQLLKLHIAATQHASQTAAGLSLGHSRRALNAAYKCIEIILSS